MKHIVIPFILVLYLCIINNAWSQANQPPELTATGDQSYCPLSQINVATSFDIDDPDDSEIEALFIQISTGYVNGQDRLILTGTHMNVTSSWNQLEGKLTLSSATGGNVSYSDLITAVGDVVFQSNSPNVSGEKFFSFTVGDANYLPSTDHYYEYVSSPGITWSQARTAAAARTYFGLQGYLATITSAEEAQLSGEQAAGTGWIGGSDAATEGVWRWVTGPENGTVFWNGGVNGTTPNYANWNVNEPNNLGNEDYAHVTAPNVGTRGSWNDLSNTGDTNPASDYHPRGYVVEYGGMPGESSLNISASTKITVPSIDSTTGAEVCDQGIMTLEATASTGTVVWFDAITGGNQVHTGPSFTTPLLTTTTNYYALASVNGCLDGARTQVTATVKTIPNIASVTNALVCDQGSATLSATASAGTINWYDLPTGGNLLNTGNSFVTPVLTNTTTYYVNATSNGCTTVTRTPVTLTVEKTPTPTGNALQTFCDIENAVVNDLVATGTDVLWYATDTEVVPLDASEPLINGTYYATQTVNSCESLTRLAVDVTIYETIESLALADIPPMQVCDTNIDGDDTNGIEEFNLRNHESILLNGKSGTDFSFLYFTDDAYNMLIPTPEAFENTVAGEQTIYVRMFNNTDNSCFTETQFEIKVNPLPETIPLFTFKNCDDEGVLTDGFTDFNLNEVNSIITTENLSDVNITFHLSMVDALTGDGAITPSPFNNQTATANTVYARVENINTGCFRSSTINLEVSTTSLPQGYMETIGLCDADDEIDGITEFDLTTVSSTFEDEFPQGQNLSVHYYHSLVDAQLEENEITNITSYENQTEFSEILYVRVESDDNGECFGIGPHLQLIVHPRPEFEVQQNSIYCLNGKPITLETFNPKGNYTYEWTDSNGTVISNLDRAEVSSGGLYTVVATSTFNCESFPVSFNVVESGISNIDIDDVSIVDLSDNNSITIDVTDIGIGDYEFALDNEFGPFQDQPFFDNVFSGDHTLYVRDKNGCGTAPLPLSVLGFPKFFTPNGDTFNDTWGIQGLGSEYSQNSTVFIYDRYGKLIKQLVPGAPGWDGTFNGKTLPNSDFWFVVNLTDNSGNTRIYRGHFSLVR